MSQVTTICWQNHPWRVSRKVLYRRNLFRPQSSPFSSSVRTDHRSLSTVAGLHGGLVLCGKHWQPRAWLVAGPCSAGRGGSVLSPGHCSPGWLTQRGLLWELSPVCVGKRALDVGLFEIWFRADFSKEGSKGVLQTCVPHVPSLSYRELCVSFSFWCASFCCFLSHGVSVDWVVPNRREDFSSWKQVLYSFQRKLHPLDVSLANQSVLSVVPADCLRPLW